MQEEEEEGERWLCTSSLSRARVRRTYTYHCVCEMRISLHASRVHIVPVVACTSEAPFHLSLPSPSFDPPPPHRLVVLVRAHHDARAAAGCSCTKNLSGSPIPLSLFFCSSRLQREKCICRCNPQFTTDVQGEKRVSVQPLNSFLSPPMTSSHCVSGQQARPHAPLISVMHACPQHF